jgi:hypothetical protein
MALYAVHEPEKYWLFLHDGSNDGAVGVQPETSNFVRVQGARKTKKRSVHAVRDHFAWHAANGYLFASLRFSGKDLLLLLFLPDHFSPATEQRGNRAKGPFPDGHCLVIFP